VVRVRSSALCSMSIWGIVNSERIERSYLSLSVKCLALLALRSRLLSPIRLARIASRFSLRSCSVQLSCCVLSFGTRIC
jgi:hypothetical protein